MADWSTLHHEILSRIHIETIYQELGLEITGRQANDNGWLTCRAMGREDKHASACINVSMTELRGRYKDSGGEGASMSIFDFAAKYGRFKDWKDARYELARRANIQLPKTNEPKRPIDSLSFLPWSRTVARFWCKKKDVNIKVEALEEAGARLANWPASAADIHKQSVIALPGYGTSGVDEDPVNWVIFADSGANLVKYDGPDRPPTFVKNLCLSNAPCLLNRWAMARIPDADVIWKVEGISDMLALHSIIPPHLKEKHVVITNGFGASEHVSDAWIRLLTGKTVRIVGDADTPGQIGAAKWMMALRGKAASVSNVALDFPVVDKHGNDARDVITERLKGTPL